MVKVTETPVHIGQGEGLSAVLTRPTETDPSRPVFVILNAGLLHRVGPFRLHVQLARRLAEEGFPALRLDMSGLGYSPKHPEHQGKEAALEDADRVFRWLQSELPSPRPVLLGSCSGAEMAHRIALADDRVAGCVFLDGYAYHTAQSKLRYYGSRVHRPDMWSKWLQSRLGPAGAEQDAATDEEEEGFWESDVPPLEQFRADLDRLVARTMPLLFVYSGSVREYQYPEQFFDLCPGAHKGPVTVRYFPNADHTYLFERDRRALLDAVSDWATTYWPGEDRG